MARYRVQGPDGKIHVFEGPDGAKPADVEAFAARQFGAPAAAPKGPDPSAGGGTLQFGPLDTGIATPEWLDRGLAGTGSGLTSVLRAVGGGRLAAAMGLPADKAEAAQLDKPLLDTTAGQVGRVVGEAAPAALAIPFTPAGILGSLAVGAGTGALTTEGGVSDRLGAAALGAGGTGLARAVPAAWRAGRGLVRGVTEPMTGAGRDRVAGRAIQRFSTDGDALDNLIASRAAARTVTGAQPTLAEATRDPGLATLQRALTTGDPEAAAALGTRRLENNAARISTLEGIAGEGAAPVAPGTPRRLQQIVQGPSAAQAEGTRRGAAAASYSEAFDQGIDPQVAAAMAPQVDALMARPSVQQAMGTARNLAAEEGLTLSNDTSVQGLHYAKQALDDMIQNATRAGDTNRARLISQTSRDLSSTLDELTPAYQAARREFQYNSVPMNRQGVARQLLDTASPERDLLGNRTLQTKPFARALNNEPQLMERATGGYGSDQLSDLMTPSQMQRIGGVRDELETLANLDKAANGQGSQTAKMLASQNLLRQVAGPVGIPQSWIESAAAEQMQRPLAFLAKPLEQRVQSRLGELMLDPAAAAGVVNNTRAYDAANRLGPGQLELLMQRALPAMSGNGAGQALTQ